MQLELKIKQHLELFKREKEHPFYLYDSEEIKRNCRLFMDIPYPHKSIHFATMANIHHEFLKIIKQEGIKVFVNSRDHLSAVEDAGYAGEEIIFTASAIDRKTMQSIGEKEILVNLDSLGQIALWEELFPGRAFGIRCNIGGRILPRKTRGGYFIGKTSRLGLTEEEITQLKSPHLVKGLHLYVGTDIMEVDYFLECYRELMALAEKFPALEFLDFGGGFGLEDRDRSKEFDMDDYGRKVTWLMEDFSEKMMRPITMILEPGRIMGGKAGYFVCRVIDVKNRNGNQLVGVNASSVQFPRPLLYPEDAFHPLEVLGKEHENKSCNSFVYGCSTYSRDFLAREIPLPEVKENDTLIFYHSGSYCASSHTSFLGFPKAEEIFV